MSINKILSPTTRNSKRKLDLITEVQTYTNTINVATENMKIAVINHFYNQKNNTTATNSSTSRVKIARMNGEVITEQDAIQRREEEERLKAEKRLQIEERKKARELKKAERALAKNNKKPKATRKPRISKKLTTKSTSFVPQTLIESECFECSKAYAVDDLENQPKWIPCEKCANWVCPSCLADDFRVSDEYISEDCK